MYEISDTSYREALDVDNAYSVDDLNIDNTFTSTNLAIIGLTLASVCMTGLATPSEDRDYGKYENNKSRCGTYEIIITKYFNSFFKYLVINLRKYRKFAY